MDRTSKPLKNDAAEPEDGEEVEPARPSLTDFLSVGLRESQRPPPPGRESQRPSGVMRTSQPPASAPHENAPPVGPIAGDAIEPPPAEEEVFRSGATDDAGTGVAEAIAASAALAASAAEAPEDESISDESISNDEPPLEGDLVEDRAGATQTESDYVVPVPIFPRPPVIGGILAAAMLIVVLVLWLARGNKPPPHVDIPQSTPAAVAHEPLPPAPPPPDPAEPIPEPEEEATSPSATKGTGSPPATEPSAAPPFGPNVARYPDLPTPVLIELEKAQEEKASTKPK